MFKTLDHIRALPGPVTPAMVQAGMEAFELWQASPYEQTSSQASQNLASYVYRAMLAAADQRSGT